MTALGEHMSAGRLDVDEYGERSARVVAAKTRGELLDVFSDLPDPRPVFGEQPVPQPAATPATAGGPGSAEVAKPEENQVGQRIAAAIVPFSAIVAVILFFAVWHVWWVFMLPAAAAVISGAILGENRYSLHETHRHHRDAMRQVHRAHRDAMRGYRYDYRRDRRRDFDE